MVREGLAEVVGNGSEGGPQRTVDTVTVEGRQRLREWLAEPAPPAVAGTEDLVRKTIVALRTTDPERAATSVVADQRTAHLRRMRALSTPRDAARADAAGAAPDDLGARLSRRYALLHLDADLRWLDEAATALETPPPPA